MNKTMYLLYRKDASVPDVLRKAPAKVANKGFIQYSKFRLGRFTNKAFNAMSLRNDGRAMVNLAIATLTVIGLSKTSGRIRSILHITRFISALVEKQGVRGATLYLKGCAVYLQQAIGLHVLKDCKAFGPAIGRKGGLPKIIPALHRAMIRRGDERVIKLYLSLFNYYRNFDWVGPVKLGTITSPNKGTNVIDIENNLEYQFAFYNALPMPITEFRTDLIDRYSQLRLFSMFKSGPTTESTHNINTHPVVAAGSARMLWGHPILRSAVLFLMEWAPARMKEAFTWLGTNIPDHVGMNSHLLYQLPGKLGLKSEAAGKVRVFAMVDPWTQWILNPLHESLFNLLRKIPQDGTFDQMKPVKAILGKGYIFSSLDLSAATDRIPVSLQMNLLQYLTGEKFAKAWKDLLVEREYYAYSKTLLPKGETVRYAVGQPMGALSSWANLALVHHFIIQCAAWHSGVVPLGTWYTKYAILGDDVIIGDKAVAASYLAILDSLGVECGLHKSLLSEIPDTLEFAKRTIFKGKDVSPIPMREFRAASLSIAAAKEFAIRYNLDFPTLLKAFGYGYKVLARVTAPIGKLNARIRALLLNEKAPKSLANVREFLMLGSPKHARWMGGTSLAESGLDVHSYYSSGMHLEGLELKKYLIKTQVRPMQRVLGDLISEFRDKVSLLKQVRIFSADLIGYYRGVNLTPPDPRTLSSALMYVWNGTHALPNAKARNGIMRIKKDLEFMVDNPSFFSFEEMYWDIFLIKKELALLPLDIIRFIRVLDPEILITVPYHIRMWKALSGYVQGTRVLPVERVEHGEFKEMPIVPGGGTNPNPLFLMLDSLEGR